MKIDEKMSPRERLLLFSTLELLRKEIQPNFADRKDADDWLFAQLDFTKDELKQIYAGRDTLYYDNSAVDFERAKRKSFDDIFIFDDELCINDDQQSINGYLWAVDALVDRLPSSIEMDNINFYADFNVKTGDIKLSSSFYTLENNEEVNKVVNIELTDFEKEELILRLEEYCQKRYHSSCVGFVNEVRERCGLEALSVTAVDSLADRISSADKIRNSQQSEHSDSFQPER